VPSSSTSQNFYPILLDISTILIIFAVLKDTGGVYEKKGSILSGNVIRIRS
jgi:hypothetical protein